MINSLPRSLAVQLVDLTPGEMGLDLGGVADNAAVSARFPDHEVIPQDAVPALEFHQAVITWFDRAGVLTGRPQALDIPAERIPAIRR